jgi:NAD(P)H dehydrogenase (quinone)
MLSIFINSRDFQKSRRRSFLHKYLKTKMKPKIAVVYHSKSGHTKAAAELISERFLAGNFHVDLVSVQQAIEDMSRLHNADTIVFGCPTMFGSPSAEFKSFMEQTGKFWYRQLWKNKFAAGFTVSSSVGGDKLNTLISLSLFAAQHSMYWISLGVLPRYMDDQQTDGQNRLASYLGLMMQSDNSTEHVDSFLSGDILTAELFADRIIETTLTYKNK